MSFTAEGSLELQVTEKENGMALVELSGRLDSTNAKQLDTALSSLIDDGVSNIILSCASLRYVSSAGLGILLKTYRAVSAQKDGHFLLCAVADNIKRVLNITGFADFIPMYEDSRQARMQLHKKGDVDGDLS